MKRFGLLIGFVALTVVSATADTYDLYDLAQGTAADSGDACYSTPGYAGHCFTVGDKVFDFTLASLSGTGTFTPPAPLTEGEFSVSTSLTGNLYGFILTGDMTATATPTDSELGTADLVVDYTVSTTSGLPLITDINAALTGSCSVILGTGGCAVNASENVFNHGTVTASLATDPMVTTLYPPPSNTPQTQDLITPQKSIDVQKDIEVAALGTTGMSAVNASLSIVDQYVSQSETPEPAFYGLLAFGFISLVWFSRKRRNA
jgi:hypothetical protein